MNNQINPFETISITEVLSEFKVNLASGLDEAEVIERQKRDGFNEVPEEKQSMALLFLRHHVMELIMKHIRIFICAIAIACSVSSCAMHKNDLAGNRHRHHSDNKHQASEGYALVHSRPPID